MNINKINPATLKITDMRFADIDGAPKRGTLVKLYTNQGLVGYGEVRDASSRTSAAITFPKWRSTANSRLKERPDILRWEDSSQTDISKLF